MKDETTSFKRRSQAFSSAAIFSSYVMIPGGIAFTSLAQGAQGPAGVIVSIPLALLLGAVWYRCSVLLAGRRLLAAQFSLFTVVTALMGLAVFRVLPPRWWLLLCILAPAVAFAVLREYEQRTCAMEQQETVRMDENEQMGGRSQENRAQRQQLRLFEIASVSSSWSSISSGRSSRAGRGPIC